LLFHSFLLLVYQAIFISGKKRPMKMKLPIKAAKTGRNVLLNC
jgi:hypothetical protein